MKSEKKVSLQSAGLGFTLFFLAGLTACGTADDAQTAPSHPVSSHDSGSNKPNAPSPSTASSADSKGNAPDHPGAPPVDVSDFDSDSPSSTTGNHAAKGSDPQSKRSWIRFVVNGKKGEISSDNPMLCELGNLVDPKQKSFRATFQDDHSGFGAQIVINPFSESTKDYAIQGDGERSGKGGKVQLMIPDQVFFRNVHGLLDFDAETLSRFPDSNCKIHLESGKGAIAGVFSCTHLAQDDLKLHHLYDRNEYEADGEFECFTVDKK